MKQGAKNAKRPKRRVIDDVMPVKKAQTRKPKPKVMKTKVQQATVWSGKKDGKPGVDEREELEAKKALRAELEAEVGFEVESELEAEKRDAQEMLDELWGVAEAEDLDEDEDDDFDEDEEAQQPKKPKKEKKMKNEPKTANKALKFLSWLVVGLGTISLAAFVGFVIYRQVLPTKYILIAVGASACLAIILILMVMGRKRKIGRRVLAILISLLMIAGSVFGFIKTGEVFAFLDRNLGSGVDVEVAEESWIMYISAIDTREDDMPVKARSDLNILAVVNPNVNKILMVNIPRDAYLPVPGVARAYDKLTHMGEIGGVEMSKAAIEDLLKVKINSTVRVNFNLLEGLVDAIGGITVNSDTAHGTYWNNNCWINAGANNLDGQCAVAYARERLSVGGDLKRAESQEQVIDAILHKISTDKSILMNYSSLLNALDGTFETNLSASDVMDLVRDQLSDMKGWSTEEMNVEPAANGMQTLYTFPTEEKFVYYLSDDSVTKVHDKIVAFMAEK